VPFRDKERKKERRPRGHSAWGAAEGGCCLLEIFAAAATCLAGLALIPLLVR
jgi:hypothetical protein